MLVQPLVVDVGFRTLGSEVVLLQPVRGGYTHQRRAIATLRDGRRVFLKQAVDAATDSWLRAERTVYQHVTGPFIARMLDWIDEPAATLVLEDLSAETWPPPWSDGGVGAVLDALEAIAAQRPPVGLPNATDHTMVSPGWCEVADDPREFLALGLCGERWLEDALPTLVAAEAAAPLDGSALLHGDVRSDNLCLRPTGAVFVDWNIALVGNPALDVAFWLPSLAYEGGPRPEACPVPIAAELAAFVAGFLAVRAGRPLLPHALRVREVQKLQLAEALPWAVRVLGLPPIR